MIQMNLLPWRTAARKAQLFRFLILLSLGLGLTLFLLMVTHIYYGSLIKDQKARDLFLQTELSQKQIQFNTLKDKKKKVVSLQAQLKVITDWRASSFHAVRLMGVLVKTASAGIVLEKISRENNVITMMGKAQSDAEVTVFIKALEQEEGFKQAVLIQLNSDKDTATVDRHFQLKIEQEEISQ